MLLHLPGPSLLIFIIALDILILPALLLDDTLPLVLLTLNEPSQIHRQLVLGRLLFLLLLDLPPLVLRLHLLHPYAVLGELGLFLLFAGVYLLSVNTVRTHGLYQAALAALRPEGSRRRDRVAWARQQRLASHQVRDVLPPLHQLNITTIL